MIDVQLFHLTVHWMYIYIESWSGDSGAIRAANYFVKNIFSYHRHPSFNFYFTFSYWPCHLSSPSYAHIISLKPRKILLIYLSCYLFYEIDTYTRGSEIF